MNDPKDDIVNKIRVREVTAVFHSLEHRDNAIEALLTHGFDHADIDLLAKHDEVVSRLGGVQVPSEELADNPVAPRQIFIDREDISVTLVLVSALAACGGALAAIWYLIELEQGPAIHDDGRDPYRTDRGGSHGRDHRRRPSAVARS